MDKVEKKYIIIGLSVLAVILIGAIIALVVLNNKAPQPSEIPTNSIGKENKKEDKINKKDEEKDDDDDDDKDKVYDVYGFDKNTMQVKDEYDGFATCGYIEIPKTNVSIPILTDQSVKGMEYSCCALCTTGELNKSGNTYIVGHNFDYKNSDRIFSNNKKLKKGDKIYITGTEKNRLEYTIYNIFNTDPTDTSYITKDIDDDAIEVCIQTCNNDKEDTRLIIEARHIIGKDKTGEDDSDNNFKIPSLDDEEIDEDDELEEDEADGVEFEELDDEEELEENEEE